MSDRSHGKASSGSQSSKRSTRDSDESSEADGVRKEKKVLRVAHCAKCKNHGLVLPKKQHKGKCNYEDCGCPKCKLINERREILRLQVQNQRRYKRELESGNKGPSEETVVDVLPKTPRATAKIPSPTVTNVPEKANGPSSQSFGQTLASLKLLNSYLASSQPQTYFRDEVYKLALLRAFENNPISVINELVCVNSRLTAIQMYSNQAIGSGQFTTTGQHSAFVPPKTMANIVPNSIPTRGTYIAPSAQYCRMSNRTTLVPSYNGTAFTPVNSNLNIRSVEQPRTTASYVYSYGNVQQPTPLNLHGSPRVSNSYYDKSSSNGSHEGGGSEVGEPVATDLNDAEAFNS